MKKYLYIFLSYLFSLELTYADGGILGDFDGETTEATLRNGDIHTGDIANIIQGSINFFMGIAGTVAIIFVIIGAYKILFGALSQDKTKGKDTIVMALGGFALASLSWFIIRLIIDNLAI